ncbi:hypothetical protein ES703_96100 [subsurface metagenome]
MPVVMPLRISAVLPKGTNLSAHFSSISKYMSGPRKYCPHFTVSPAASTSSLKSPCRIIRILTSSSSYEIISGRLTYSSQIGGNFLQPSPPKNSLVSIFSTNLSSPIHRACASISASWGNNSASGFFIFTKRTRLSLFASWSSERSRIVNTVLTADCSNHGSHLLSHIAIILNFERKNLCNSYPYATSSHELLVTNPIRPPSFRCAAA